MQLWEIEKERYQEGREAGLVEGRTEVVPFLIEMFIKMIGDEETSINEVTNTVPSLNMEQVRSVWYEYKKVKNVER